MYLLFVDESGTHGGSHAFVLGGVAVHEDDAQRMQRAIDELVIRRLGRVPLNLDEFELHASEMRNAKKPKPTSARTQPIASIWASYPRSLRLALLDDAYDLIANFRPGDARLPVSLFGVVLDKNFHEHQPQVQREQFAYEVLLNKFDVMLKTVRQETGIRNRGLVIHDRRVVAERDIQSWTSEWRVAAGTVGKLNNLADVPLFADSRATRLLQVADLVSYVLFRRYRPGVDEVEPEFVTLWPAFHRQGEVIHGCVHFSPSFGQGACQCEPCASRLELEALDRHTEKSSVQQQPRRQRRRRRINRASNGTSAEESSARP